MRLTFRARCEQNNRGCLTLSTSLRSESPAPAGWSTSVGGSALGIGTTIGPGQEILGWLNCANNSASANTVTVTVAVTIAKS